MNLKHLHQWSLRLSLSLALVIVGMGGIAGARDFLNDESYEDQALIDVYDPLEPFNRVVFTFNDRVFLWVFNPVATGYSKVLPSDIRGCIGNFFYNIREPIRSVNCLLQGRFRDSGLALSRFFINTIGGVFGLADAATEAFKIGRVKGTLGQTFSVWGIGDGFYLVVPLLGPSTLRDFSGDLGEALATTDWYYPWDNDFVTSSAVFGIQYVNYISLHLGAYEDIKAMSVDPYVAFRNGYFQARNKTSDHLVLPNPTMNSININR